MSHVLIVGAQPLSLVNFRGELIKALVAAGHSVTTMATNATPQEIASLQAMGADYREYTVQRSGLNPLVDLTSLWQLGSTFRELRPDVVLAYTIKPIIWGGLAARGVRPMRFYALVTGLGFAFHGKGLARGMLTRLVSRLYQAGLARADGIIFQNVDNATVFVKRRIAAASRVSVTAGSGVNLDQFPRAPLPSGDVVFLIIARLLREKGLREFAAAARMVKEKYPMVQFQLVGAEDPSPDGIPHREVAEWQEQGTLIYHGSQPDVRPFLAACSVFVLPSYHEGMPRSVLEALATGRPILTTNVPGCRDTVVEGENGFLVPAGNAVALAERMAWFVENRREWPRMAAHSRVLAEARFDVKRVNEQLLHTMQLGG